MRKTKKRYGVIRFFAGFLLKLFLVAIIFANAAACVFASDDMADQETHDLSDAGVHYKPLVSSLEMGDTSLRYFKFGSGEKSMVILPGLNIAHITKNADLFAEAYADFCDEYTVYLFEVKDDVPEDSTLTGLSEDTACAFKMLGIMDAYITGISMGGFIGIYLAAEYPELVSKLLLVASAARSNEANDKMLNRWSKLADVGSRHPLVYNMMSKIYSNETIEMFGDQLIAGYELITASELKRFSNTARAIIGFDYTDKLSDITCSLYVIGCYGDEVLGPDSSLEIAESTGCGIYMYPDRYGHGVYDEADDYIDRVMEFFSE